MKRSVPVARLVRHTVSLTLGCGLLSLLLAGCPGSLDPALMGGSGGMEGGGIGGVGGGATCDANTILMTKCAQAACHSNLVQFAGINLTPPVAATALIGVMPNTCTSGAFLDPNSNPATGILLQNLMPSPTCGVQMPYQMTPLVQADIDCLQQWANGLVNGGQ